MGKNRSSAPAAPDPAETAEAEARFNRLDVYSPSGSGVVHGYTDEKRGFTQDPGNDRQAAVKYIESPTERALREALEPASIDLTNRVIADNITGLPDAARVKDRSDVASDLFNRTFSLMAPGIQKSNETLLGNLQARGIPIGSEAFNESYGNQLAQTQDTVSRLALDANLNAGAEQSRQFGLDAAQRSGAISELVAAMGGGYNPPNPTPSGQAAPVNYSGLVSNQYNQQLAQYNAQQQQSFGAASTLGSLGGALLKSSVTFKEIINLTDAVASQVIVQTIPVCNWRYRPEHAPAHDHGGQHVGPMAEAFHKLTGLGVPTHIDPVDFFGLLTSALQGALERISVLENALEENGLVEAGPLQQEVMH